jgi:hypothetical protein
MSHCEFIDDEKSWLWAWDTIITPSYQTNSVSAVTKLSLCWSEKVYKVSIVEKSSSYCWAINTIGTVFKLLS